LAGLPEKGPAVGADDRREQRDRVAGPLLPGPAATLGAVAHPWRAVRVIELAGARAPARQVGHEAPVARGALLPIRAHIGVVRTQQARRPWHPGAAFERV